MSEPQRVIGADGKEYILCEVCGMLAPWIIQDTREGEPWEPLESPSERWRTFIHVGTHYFCNDHVRRPIQYIWNMRTIGNAIEIQQDTVYTFRFLELNRIMDWKEASIKALLGTIDYRPMSELMDPEGILLYSSTSIGG